MFHDTSLHHPLHYAFISCPISSPIDVLSLLHSLVFALHISHAFSLTSRYSTWGFLDAPPAHEAEYTLSCRRSIISSWTFVPSYTRHSAMSLVRLVTPLSPHSTFI